MMGMDAYIQHKRTEDQLNDEQEVGTDDQDEAPCIVRTLVCQNGLLVLCSCQRVGLCQRRNLRQAIVLHCTGRLLHARLVRVVVSSDQRVTLTLQVACCSALWIRHWISLRQTTHCAFPCTSGWVCGRFYTSQQRACVRDVPQKQRRSALDPQRHVCHTGTDACGAPRQE